MLTQFIGRITTSIVLAAVAIGAGTAIAAAQSSTDWGWPQPYEKVSDKSVAWLKEKGWWPLGVGHSSGGCSSVGRSCRRSPSRSSKRSWQRVWKKASVRRLGNRLPIPSV